MTLKKGTTRSGIAGRDRKPTPVRCMKTRKDGTRCYWRGTLSKPPAQFVRPPKCPKCGKAITIIDSYRIAKEWKKRPCNCYGYAFPHARGRGYCDHNPNLTAEDLRLREEGGPRRDPVLMGDIREDWRIAWQAARLMRGSYELPAGVALLYQPACDIAWTRHFKPYWRWPIVKRLSMYKMKKHPDPDDIPF